ncbi:MAG: SMP-30/gluconolactonase/LRE family protein [Chloroflexi bacterium]|nr:SMP-30/gluconolactonase/LRE family protein [Chloroflexota bacterium]
MKTLKPTLLTEGLIFPEAPRWRDGKLWLSDIWGHKVLTVDDQGRKTIVAEIHKRPSGLGFLPDGSLLISTMETAELLRLKNGNLTTVANLRPFAKNGCNDMVVDGKGRAYVDGYNPAQPLPTGSIILVTPDGKATEVAKDLVTPNGCCVTPDGKTFLVNQMGGDEITAFDIQPDGTLANRRVWAKTEGKPDGLCLDAEGAAWVGLFELAKFQRILPGGKVTHEIHFPKGTWTVAPMLGGKDRKTLYMICSITTIEDIVQRGKSKGAVYTARAEVPGAGWP